MQGVALGDGGDGSDDAKEATEEEDEQQLGPQLAAQTAPVGMDILVSGQNSSLGSERLFTARHYDRQGVTGRRRFEPHSCQLPCCR